MNLNQQLSKYLVIFILLVIGAGVQADVLDRPGLSIDPLPQQGKSWCPITPYLQQIEAEGSIRPTPQKNRGRWSSIRPTSQKNKGGWSIGPTSGIIWGRAREIVFDNSDVQNENDYLSELIWELKQVFVFGIDSLWQGKRSNGLEMKFSFAIPNMSVGKMDDYDWYFSDREWSHWSQSNVKQRWGFIFDFLYEGVLVKSGPFNLKFGAGYHMDWWGWKDEIVDSRYSTVGSREGRTSPDSFSTAKGDRFRDRSDILPVGVNGIDYWAMYHVPLISLRNSFEWNVITLNVLGRIGPVLGIAKDHHLRRREYGPDGVYFYDVVFGGPWVDAILEVGFKITDRHSFLLRGEFAWLRETRGLSITVPTNTRPTAFARRAGGLAFQRFGVTALVLWKLGQ